MICIMLVGVEGQRLMHALQQPSLELECDTSQQRLQVLAQQPQLLSERQAVISQRLRWLPLQLLLSTLL